MWLPLGCRFRENRATRSLMDLSCGGVPLGQVRIPLLFCSFSQALAFGGALSLWLLFLLRSIEPLQGVHYESISGTSDYHGGYNDAARDFQNLIHAFLGTTAIR